MAATRGMANVSTRLERWKRTGGFEFVLHLSFSVFILLGGKLF